MSGHGGRGSGGGGGRSSMVLLGNRLSLFDRLLDLQGRDVHVYFCHVWDVVGDGLVV